MNGLVILYCCRLPTLSDGEHKPLRGWGTIEDRALRDMSLSAGVMVKKGIPDQNFYWNCPWVQTAGVMVRRGTPDQFFFGKILLANGKIFSGPKKFFRLLFFKFEILSHATFGAIFGEIGRCFRQNRCMQLGAWIFSIHLQYIKLHIL